MSVSLKSYKATFFCLFLLFAGCAGVTPFEPRMNLALAPDVDLNKKFAKQKSNKDDELLLMASFSGGGTRAAALAYGVLEALKEQPSKGDEQTNLLMELDYISAVSGGSFTAAYYALFGERLFTDFKPKFLEKNVHSAIRQKLFSSKALKNISSEKYGVSDLLAEYYDEEIFEHKTLADLFSANGVVVDINAVDISRGTRFSFNKSQLSIICTDPKSIPVARAVAASSAVPVVFSAISLRNFAAQCHQTVPEWVSSARNDTDDALRQNEAQRVYSYLKPGKRKFIHLLDGGLADNLGVRASIARTLAAGGLKNALKDRGLDNTKKIIYVVVDAANWPPITMDETNDHPPIESIISAATSAPIVQYNIETLNLLRKQFGEWSTQTGGEAHVIHLSFDQLNDTERDLMLAMPTNLALDPDQLEKVIQAGRTLLLEHPEFKSWQQGG